MTHASRVSATGPGAWTLLAIATLVAIASCTTSHEVRGHGMLEIDEVDVASLVGGRVVRLYVDEGDTVSLGDTLAVLDRGEVTADLEAQVAQAERAAALYQDLRAGSRAPEVRAARADLAAATAAAEAAELDYRRTQELFDANMVSAADRDHAKTTRDAAVARRDAAREQLKLVEMGYRSGQVEAAGRSAQAARAQLVALQSRAQELVLTAPIRGVVLLRNFDIGEVAAAGQPVVTLGDPDRVWSRIYVPAPELPRVHRGAAVEVRVQGMPRAFVGRVTEIATEAEFTPRSALTEEERANLVFGVKVRLDPTDGVLKPGLPAEALIAATPVRRPAPAWRTRGVVP